MGRKENLQEFIKQQKAKSKNPDKIKIGTIDTFNVGGLESTIPTLHMPMDDLVGGFQRGIIMEVYGDESAGKSTTIGKVIENLVAFRPDDEAELSILFVDIPTMTELHVQWMDEPGPTDVLSFPMDELRPGKDGAPSDPGILGDIVVCPDVAIEQARTAGHSAQEEMLLLVTHVMLHLLGFDHAEPDEREVMFDLQRTLLLTFLATR